MTTSIQELQENIVDGIIALLKKQKTEVSVKAPTGSGKTHMMAMLMDKLLMESDKYIFIVSSPSKGDLAEQCYNSFVKNSDYNFKNLDAYLISTGYEYKKNTEFSIQIDWGHNVYVLPTNQFTSASRIKKERSFLSFILKCQEERKEIILIRDESHIATKNLDEIKEFFAKTINFSATPKDNKYDLALSEEDAIKAKLIKSVEFINNQNDELEEGLSKALTFFKEKIRPTYLKHDIVPAFIIQISNMEKGAEQFEVVKKIVDEQGLQWASFVNNEKQYETNNALIKNKNRKIWRELIKQSNYPIDVIIFKMVITEGFDIPRACVLYQVRDTFSKTLDEQVIGRVRRNPDLLNFGKYEPKVQEHFSKAYVYGVKENKRKKQIRLRGDDLRHNMNEIIKEFTPFKSVALREVAVSDIDISKCIKNNDLITKSVFSAYRELDKCDGIVKKKLAEYAKSFKQWFVFVNNLEEIKEEVKTVVEDYESYGEVIEIFDGLRNSVYAFMNVVEDNNFACENCMWTDDNDDEFSYDSKAELAWFKILNKIKTKCCKSICIDDASIYLFGKNYVDAHSNMKFDYYYRDRHTSYPDFIFKDKNDAVHIFEVKSVNGGNNVSFNTEKYEEKISKLKKAYRYASKKTGYVFYIPIQKDDDWQIWCYENGEELKMNRCQFEKYLQNRIN